MPQHTIKARLQVVVNELRGVISELENVEKKKTSLKRTLSGSQTRNSPQKTIHPFSDETPIPQAVYKREVGILGFTVADLIEFNSRHRKIDPSMPKVGENRARQSWIDYARYHAREIAAYAKIPYRDWDKGFELELPKVWRECQKAGKLDLLEVAYRLSLPGTRVTRNMLKGKIFNRLRKKTDSELLTMGFAAADIAFLRASGVVRRKLAMDGQCSHPTEIRRVGM